MTAVLDALEWLLAAAVLLTPTVLGVLWFRARFRIRIERKVNLVHIAASADERQPFLGPPRVMRVDCTQFATCGWHGKRLVEKLGVQPKPCPKCGKPVSA